MVISKRENRRGAFTSAIVVSYEKGAREKLGVGGAENHTGAKIVKIGKQKGKLQSSGASAATGAGKDRGQH